MSIPGSGSPLLLASTAAAAAAEYVIPKSLRFNSGDSAHLTKTFGSGGNQRTWTWSGWVKRSKLSGSGKYPDLFGSFYGNSSRYLSIRFDPSDRLFFYGGAGSPATNVLNLTTTQVFRDFSAWYHIVVAFDTSQSTASDRAKLYVNGTQITDFDTETYPAQNVAYYINQASVEHAIGSFFGTGDYLDGYMADVQFVDGQQLAPTDFGETRSSDGVWVPKEYTFGTNPNNGTTWSDGVTFSGSIIAAATKAFDGNPATSAAPYDGANGGGTPQWVQVTFSPGIPYTSSVRVERRNGNPTNVTVSMNGGTAINSAFLAYTTVATGSGTLTSIKVQNNGSTNTAGISRIEVDGYVLLDGARDNSFHLNFSDSSTNEALGFDSAPTIPALDPKKGMDVVTWTGNGTAGTNIGGLGFEPDFVWIKRRNAAYGHVFSDSVRGFGATGWAKQLIGNSTEAENSGAVNTISSFNPDGFTLGTDGGVNLNSSTYVGWCWRAGGPAVANSDGTITSQVSANTDYGFSIVSYTGNNTSGATVGHGLSSAPKWIVVKSRDQSGQFWHVYHASLAANEYIYLNSNAVKTSGNDFMNGTRPTSSVFSLGNGNGCNKSSDPVIAYCWSEVSGFSKFDGFNGDGNSGKKITTGFKPKFVIIKRTDTIENWHIFDSERGGTKSLFPDITNAEVDNSSRSVAFVSDGFTLGTQGGINASGGTYIYAAFADRPGNNWDVNNIVTNEGLTTSKTQFDVVLWTGNSGTSVVGGPVYSASSTVSSPTNVFNGDTSNGGVFNNAENRVLTASSITITSSLEIYHNRPGSDGITVNINGTDYVATGLGSTGYHTIPIPGSDLPLTSTGNITIKDNVSGASSTVYAVRVDNTVLIDGTGVPLKFQPDLVWLKSRSHTYDHYLTDSVRGATKSLRSNTTAAEDTLTQGLTAFNSDGFTVGNEGQFNNTGRTMVAWCWKAGGTAVSNTDGSITSSVSANAAYGFSVVTYTGTGSAATVGHGLNGKVPELIIVKNRDKTYNWAVWSSQLSSNAHYLFLNSTDGQSNSYYTFWNNTAPTGSVFSVGANSPDTAGNVNESGDDMVAYCFANVPGYQRIGSYTGNGSSTGPVVVTGFKPRFILLRSTSGPRGWLIYDTERDTSSTNDNCLFPNTNGAENSDSSHNIEILDNGFQLKTTSANRNASGEKYIYLAIGDDEIGSDEDCLVDVPNAVTADADATDTTGGYQRGNYAVLNPLDTKLVHSNGNLDATASTSQTWTTGRANIGITSGKFYWEVTVNGVSHTSQNTIQLGISALTAALPANDAYQDSNSFVYANYTGYKASGGSESSYGDSYGVGDTVGVAYDADNGTLEFYVNGVSQGDAYTSLDATKNYAPVITLGRSSTSTSISANFGQMRFKYPMPSGYAALNTTALPAATIPDGSDQFDATTYAGNSSTQNITGINHGPDLVWIKTRNDTSYHFLSDSVRGPNKHLASNATDAEGTDTAITAFNSDGFSLANQANVNSSYNYVAWTWNAGSSTVSNTDGSITSSVRANQSAGFSIVSWTSSSSVSTVGHGLSDAPYFIITKNRSVSNAWWSYHFSIGNTKAIRLDTTDTPSTMSSAWNNTSPTNSVFTVGGEFGSGNSMIAYCFAPVAGYSAIGSYEGNGSTDGPFVYTGFRPRWVMIKPTNITESWNIIDAARSPFNQADDYLSANTGNAENSAGAASFFDFTSNGFKVRGSGNYINGSGNTMIYLAFAENPFQANGGLAR